MGRDNYAGGGAAGIACLACMHGWRRRCAASGGTMLTWWPLLASLVPGATNAASDVAACASTNGSCFRTVQQCVDAVLSAPCDDGQDGTACDAGGRCDPASITKRSWSARGRAGAAVV